MATKDNLKHFSDVDGYSDIVTKSDMDNNLDLLADGIDNTPFDSDDNKIYSKKSLGFVVGAKKFDLEDTDNGDSKIFFDRSQRSFRGGYVSNDNWNENNRGDYSFSFGNDTKATGDYSFGLGNTTITSGDYSFAFGNDTKATGDYSFALGYKTTASGYQSLVIGKEIENKQDISFSEGASNTNSKAQLTTFQYSVETTDDTQTNTHYPIKLWLKSLNYIIIKGTIIKDDYSTKWIFERKLIVRVDDEGSITIDDDNNTDIVKDDSDWKFDIEAVNDGENPTIKMKVTGKSDTNIDWGIAVENRQTYWNN